MTVGTTSSVRIYLDSSDFSRLSDKRKLEKTPGLSEAHERIVDLSARGMLDVRFSIFHVIEAVHVDPASKQYARERAATIKRLCNRRAFLHPARLYVHEGATVVDLKGREDVASDRSYAYVENAEWLPRYIQATAERLADSFRRGFQNRVLAEIKRTISETGNRRVEDLPPRSSIKTEN
jgi:hypothetical protein